MSDRNLPEPARADAQLLQKLLRDVAALKKRAWTGGQRTAAVTQVTVASATASGLLAITVPPGNWAVFGSLRAEAILVGAHAFNVHAELTSAEDGTSLASEMAIDQMTGQVPGTGQVRLPMHLLGTITPTVRATLTMLGWGSTALSTNFMSIRWLLQPW